MTFAQAIRTCFSKYATFSGRARRSEYWFWILFTSLVTASLYIVVIILAVAIVRNDPYADISSQHDPLFGIIGLIILVFLLATLLPTIAAQVRRLHDTGRSGALAWLSLVPIANIFVIVWCCEDTGPDNQYGPSTKGPLGANPAFGQYYGPSPFGGPPPPQPYGGQHPGQPYPQPYQPYGGPPQYGQQPNGQPQYGQPQNGQQPPYGQPPNGGQPPYGGQPEYGSPYGQPPAGEHPPEQGSPGYGPPR